MSRDRAHGDRDEVLSALADGEVAPGECSELVDRLLADGALTERWERYRLARGCLQGIAADAVGRDFSARVRAAVAEEAPIVAPERARRGRGRPLAGLAVAAAVALVAIGSLAVLQQRDLQRTLTGGGPVAVATPSEDRALAGADVFASADGAGGRQAVRQRLSRYLMSHNRVAGAGDLPAVVPASRLAGLNNGQ